MILVSSHARFVLMLKEAEAACLDRCLDPVEDQIAQGNWVTGMTLAERRFPQEFGRNQRIEIESNATITYVHDVGPAAERAILARRAELETLQASSELATGGAIDTPTPLLPAATDTHTDA